MIVCKDMECICVAKDINPWQAVMSMTVKLQFPHNAGDFNWLPLKKGSAAWTYLVS
jgi:hypothetical protein